MKNVTTKHTSLNLPESLLTQAREEMENLLDTKVNLKLWVKVRKDWRDSDILLKNYGYNKKEL